MFSRQKQAAYAGRKKTLQQHLQSAFKKAAVVTAISTGVAGYHFYGTQEDIDVTVATITADDAGGTIITTDNGTFINSASLAHLKFEDKTQDLDDRLRPGARLTLRAYGLNPRVGDFGLHSFGLHRPILKATVRFSPGTLAIENPPPDTSWLRFFRSTQPYSLQTTEGVTLTQNFAQARSCVNSDDLSTMQARNPQVYRDLALMERLPITGRPVFKIVTDSRYKSEACLIPFNANSATAGTHLNGTINIMRSLSADTTLHEYFHALQDFREEAAGTIYNLTPTDYAVANALSEAAALSYAVMAAREARNRGLTPAPSAQRSYISAGERAENIAIFDAAYETAYAANEHMTATARETAALEAGGQALVRTMMAGHDRHWTTHYRTLIRDNLNANLHILARNNGTGPTYADLRRDAFYRAGMVTPGLNLIPTEYLGAEAPRYIAAHISTLGLRIPAPRASAARPGA